MPFTIAFDLLTLVDPTVELSSLDLQCRSTSELQASTLLLFLASDFIEVVKSEGLPS